MRRPRRRGSVRPRRRVHARLAGRGGRPLILRYDRPRYAAPQPCHPPPPCEGLPHLRLSACNSRGAGSSTLSASPSTRTCSSRCTNSAATLSRARTSAASRQVKLKPASQMHQHLSILDYSCVQLDVVVRVERLLLRQLAVLPVPLVDRRDRAETRRLRLVEPRSTPPTKAAACFASKASRISAKRPLSPEIAASVGTPAGP